MSVLESIRKQARIIKRGQFIFIGEEELSYLLSKNQNNLYDVMILMAQKYA